MSEHDKLRETLAKLNTSDMPTRCVAEIIVAIDSLTAEVAKLREGRTFVEHPMAPMLYHDQRGVGAPSRPSDQAIASAVFGGAHCQYHPDGHENCATFAWILWEAERIERGEQSWYEQESARLATSADAMRGGAE